MPRRSRRWLLPAIVVAGLVVVLLVVGFLYVRSERGQEQIAASSAGSLAPSDGADAEEAAEAVEPDVVEAVSAGSLAPSDATDEEVTAEAVEPDTEETAAAGDTDTAEQPAIEPAGTEVGMADTDVAASTEALGSLVSGGTELSASEQDAAASETDGAALDETQAADEVASSLSLAEPEPEAVPAEPAELLVEEPEETMAVAEEELQPTTTGVEVDGTVATTVTEIAEPDQVVEVDVASAPPPEGQLPVEQAGSASGIRVQLAAYGSAQRAQTAWSELGPDLADILGDHEPMIEEAVLASGTFYRLQIGSFGSSIEARDFCDALLARRYECLVVPQ